MTNTPVFTAQADILVRGILRDEIRLSWDDAWGSCLSNLGALCDVFWLEGGVLPESVAYFPGVFGPDVTSYPASMFVELLGEGVINLRAIEYWIHVLDRFADLVPEDKRY